MFLPDIQECLQDHLKPFVQKGAALLDEKVPNWICMIDTTKLSIAKGELCICGQIFGDYAARTVAVLDPEDYGFTVFNLPERFLSTGCFCCDPPQLYLSPEVTRGAWTALDNLWLDEIYWRCSE